MTARAPAGLLALACAWSVSACGQAQPPSRTPAATAPRETPVQAQIARGAELYTADRCAACHSTDANRGIGPTHKGLANSTVMLTSGRPVRATLAYLRRWAEQRRRSAQRTRRSTPTVAASHGSCGLGCKVVAASRI